MATARFEKRQDAGAPPLTVAVEGVIGAGKTTLAKALAEQLGAARLLEEEIDNPFLERFYKNRQRWAFACQFCFLEGRIRQFGQSIPAGIPVVADHSLIKDPLFAAVNLAEDELSLYERVFQRMADACTFAPRVTVYLIASATEARERIRRRGHRMEGSIDLPYLQQLVDAYQGWFNGPGGQQGRVVVVNTDGCNIAQEPAAVGRLLEACLQAPLGLSYCNPVG